MSAGPQRWVLGAVTDLLKGVGQGGAPLGPVAKRLRDALPAPGPGEPPTVLWEVLDLLADGGENEAFFRNLMKNASRTDLQELLFTQFMAKDDLLP